jgi:hypothetical protein
MARHRRRRHHGGVVSVQGYGRHRRRRHTRGFGFINKSVNSTDVLVGAAAGLVGGMLVKMGLNQVFAGNASALSTVDQFGPILTGGLVGAGLYFFQRKKNPTRANGHFAGAVVAGGGVSAWKLLKAQFPDLADTVSLRVDGMGYLIDDVSRRTLGYLVPDAVRGSQYGGYGHDGAMARLAAATMDLDDDYDDIAVLNGQVR